MTTVCGFSEMKRVACWTGIVARTCGASGKGAVREITAGAAAIRFAAEAHFVVEDVVRATSTHGPQWDDVADIAMAEGMAEAMAEAV